MFIFDQFIVGTLHDVINLHGLTITIRLAYAENQFDENTSLEIFLATADDTEIGYAVKIDSKDPNESKQKTR